MSIQAESLQNKCCSAYRVVSNSGQVYGMLTSTSINLFANVWLEELSWLEECSVL